MATQQVIPRKEAIRFSLTFAPALLIYLLTMPKGLTWAHFGVDGGELIAASVTLGVPHPPGYPLYVLLGKLFSYLPIGSIAYRFNLLSAVSMAAAAGILTLTADVVLNKTAVSKRYIPIIVGLSFAFAPLVWQQAIIAEVYGLFLFFVALTVWGVLSRKRPFLVGLFWGLAIVSHLTALLLAPLLLIEGGRHYINKQVATGLLVGSSPFLLLPLFALSRSPIIWGDPVTFRGWLSVVTAEIYRPLPFQAPASIIQSRILEWGEIGLNQLTLAGPVLLLIALVAFYQTPKLQRIGWGLLITAVSYIIYAITYNTPDAIIFTLPAIYLLLILIGNSLRFLEAWGVLLPIALLLLNFNTVNISQDQFVHQQLEHVLEQAPQNAVIETNGDPILFALWYAVFAEQHRQDILVIDQQLFGFDWYERRLRQSTPSLSSLDRLNFAAFKEAIIEKRPYCTIVYQEERNQPIEVYCFEKP